MTFYPTLKSLKQKLQIQPVNTGKQFTHNGQACGIVFDEIMNKVGFRMSAYPL